MINVTFRMPFFVLLEMYPSHVPIKYCFRSSSQNIIILNDIMLFYVTEPILTEGYTDFTILKDGWTCVACDGSR